MSEEKQCQSAAKPFEELPFFEQVSSTFQKMQEALHEMQQAAYGSRFASSLDLKRAQSPTHEVKS
jgi:hypothetical protein